MKSIILNTLCLLLFASSVISADDQALDRELSRLSESVAGQVQRSGVKKVTVLDFTDIAGRPSSLGAYIAEDMTVNLVSTNRSFAIVDRAHVNRIIAEHELSLSGLMQPDNVKKFGKVSGIDAVIIGSMTPIDGSVKLTVKIMSTETADILGGAKGQILKTAEIDKLLGSQPAGASLAAQGDHPTNAAPSVAVEPKPLVSTPVNKSLGELGIEIESLHIVNGGQYLLTMHLKNQNSRHSIYVALLDDGKDSIKGSLTDANRNEYGARLSQVSGIVAGGAPGFYVQPETWLKQSTEIAPHESIPVTMKFSGNRSNGEPTPGKCRLQLEFLQVNAPTRGGGNYLPGTGVATPRTLLVELIAD